MEALPFGPRSYSGHLCTLPDRDVRVVGYHARPDDEPRGGIVIATDIGGVRPLFTDMCDRLASHGFSTVAIEPFDRLPEVKDKAPGDRLLDVARLVDANQVGDLVAAAGELRTWDGVRKVTVLGFCMGGMFALKAAASGAFDQSVACYGMLRLPEDWRGPGLTDALDSAATVCPTIAIMGDADPFVPGPQVEELRALWAQRPDCEVVVVPGAEHGFIHDPERPAHRPADAAALWGRLMAVAE